MNPSIFLLFLAFAASHAGKPCEWIGDAPFCGSQNCYEGLTELARTGSGVNDGFTADFGNECITGMKTLCCKKTFVQVKHKNHCGRYPHEAGCPSGRFEVAEEKNGWYLFGVSYTKICCDQEIFANKTFFIREA
ncbi:hypothetical protein PENTCL1PPCAC_9113 [Pristionchus entomophagus]|uniref:Uncharacterized protein n=1 Tax=Pristionchus entomophagus TaxID=358040 RepID=A0AAV5T267_9BILA|nr:hypothetical protein PENTCL1PPCAC_9113 [Pristionchus entomophagus]